MEKEYSISKKKVDKLYNEVHEAIIKARINIATGVTDPVVGRFVDNILSDLCYKAPQKAIDVFKKAIAPSLSQKNRTTEP